MRSVLLAIMGICSPAACWAAASVVEGQLRHAQVYMEAGEYGAAEKIYLTLYAEEPDLWKKAILQYNMAVTYLLAGNNDRAVEIFSQIPLDKNTPPLFVRDVKGNLAIAKWRQAKGFINKIEAGKANFPDNFLRAGDELRSVFRLINEAEQAQCKLAQQASCKVAQALEEVRLAAHQWYAWLLVKYQQERIARLTAVDGVPLLMGGIGELSTDLEDVLKFKTDSTTAQQQYERISEQTLTWLAVWSALEKIIEDKSLFNRAKTAFIEAASLTKQNDPLAALNQYKQSQSFLDQLYLKLIANDRTVDALSRLLSLYDNIRNSFSIQETALQSLAGEQTNLLKLIPQDEKAEKLTRQAESALSRSIEYAHQGQQILAIFYLVTGQEKIYQLLWKFEPHTESLPIQILEQGIEEERYAVALLRILGLLEEYAGVDKDGEMVKEVFKVQQMSLQASLPFIAEAFKGQQHGFATEKPPCQYHPWNEAIPLFIEGETNATAAVKNLKKGKLINIEVIKHEQDKVLELWNKALELLKNPKEKGSCNSSQQGGGGGEENQTSVDQVLRLLQKMEQDDRQQKKRSPEGTSQGIKPW